MLTRQRKQHILSVLRRDGHVVLPAVASRAEVDEYRPAIQRGAATRVTSLMYLVPPCTALLAWLLFGETLTGLVLLGLVLTAIRVGLVVKER